MGRNKEESPINTPTESPLLCLMELLCGEFRLRLYGMSNFKQ